MAGAEMKAPARPMKDAPSVAGSLKMVRSHRGNAKCLHLGIANVTPTPLPLRKPALLLSVPAAVTPKAQLNQPVEEVTH